MKKWFISFVCMVHASLLSAQESYTIRMQARVEGLPKEYAAYSEQDITTYIKGEKSKTEVSSMMYSSEVYFRNDSLTMLNDVMGDKIGYTVTKSELENSNEAAKARKPEILYTKETKSIAGYLCTKAIVTQLTGTKKEKPDTIRTIVWVTEKIKTDQTPRHAQQRRGGIDLGDLKGHPLEMEMTHRQDGADVKIKMTTTSVSTSPLGDEIFTPQTGGYRMVKYSEWRESMKGKER